MPLSIGCNLFRNIVVGRTGRRLFCLPVGLFGGQEDGGIDCQLHHHVCFDWREALRLGLLSLTQQMFHGEKNGGFYSVSEPADGKLKLFALVMLHLHSHVVATRPAAACIP